MKISDYINFNELNIAYIKVKITAKSSKNELFSVLSDNTLKIRIKGVRENGKANKELISFLTEELALKKGEIEIISGSQEETKTIKISK
ncbi:MAG: DUF167 domain-containing protein [Candidatus Gracilibacteria bacterium]|nr:DUF167 domain-containing protein [Candidatus Gracilibacteria bacterium]